MDNDEQMRAMSAGIACVHEHQRPMMNVSSYKWFQKTDSEQHCERWRTSMN
jgi:hypothetical protein